eukprot:CAMPEP_0194320508 /NCGR_PEP_ID=MMETSP0171-20130528/16820_1 /TAXON_ID=218684 /ORGANISM="Corethron pennatum, Strain L29A3" /LENGTH=474 /DNA_ID=CAMNT_0039078057 /DNA_START=61 /DNA_END=1485 /DNA_ORIENTATION=-
MSTSIEKTTLEEHAARPECHVAVDPDQDDRATEMPLQSFARCHMRAFHCAWFGLFISVVVWRGFFQVLGNTASQNGISESQEFYSFIVALIVRALAAFLLGPLCDIYGARRLMVVVLLSSVSVALIGATLKVTNNVVGFYIVQSLVGISGATTVMSQFWTSNMFAKEIAGTTNSFVAGFGRLGDQAATYAASLPVGLSVAVVACSWGALLTKISDESPRGELSERSKIGDAAKVSTRERFLSEIQNTNMWILFVQYACCAGAKHVHYYYLQLGLGEEEYGKLVSAFSFNDMLVRIIVIQLGGYISDNCSSNFGMRGRLIWQSICLGTAGFFVIIAAHSQDPFYLLVNVSLMSVFIWAAMGSTYGIVPYANTFSSGTFIGIVCAGEFIGSLCFEMGFRNMPLVSAFNLTGGCLMGSAVLSALVRVNGHLGLFPGQDCQETKNNYTGELEITCVGVAFLKNAAADEESSTSYRNLS